MILFEGSLSLMGFGLQPPHTSLGSLIHEGWRSVSIAPHLIWFPCLVVAFTLWIFESLKGHASHQKRSLNTPWQRG
jgi:ABC-type dipeptide/oligopeptide/nickel transport system permease subunit